MTNEFDKHNDAENSRPLRSGSRKTYRKSSKPTHGKKKRPASSASFDGIHRRRRRKISW